MNVENNNKKKKAELCRMTWREAEEAFTKKPVILIPMGSIEQHGPQTPTGDYRYMIEIAQQIAGCSEAICAPTIPWGYSEYFKHFPGCLTLQAETLKAVLFDIIDGFIRYDLDHIIFVCGHKGNMPILEHVARVVKERNGIRMATIEPLSWLTAKFMQKAYGNDTVQTGHGSDPMTSLAMHLFPEDVRMDMAEKGNPSVFEGYNIKGMSMIDFEGYPAYVYCDTEEITQNGVFGDSSHASSDVGRQCTEHMVDIGGRFVKWFALQNSRC